MKKLLSMVAAVLAVASLSVGVASAAPVAPAQCTGTYTKTVELNGNASYYNGTAQNELIVVNGQYSYVLGNGGDDCIVLNGQGSLAYGGAGQDVLIDNAGRASLKGDGGADKLYSNVGGAALDGGASAQDTCVGDYNKDSFKNCEL